MVDDYCDIFQTLNPTWDEEFIFRVLPTQHKLVLQGKLIFISVKISAHVSKTLF